MLQSVHATGKGTIDLILKNNTGVEVKYWQATTVLSPRGITSLAKQMQGFNDNLPHLTRIRVEFVQTANNPVTRQTIRQLEIALRSDHSSLDMSRITFHVVTNPGIP